LFSNREFELGATERASLLETSSSCTAIAASTSPRPPEQSRNKTVWNMRRPNILILSTDQQRMDALGANGNPAIKTPNLDRLAAAGTTFTSCFSQNPLCMPSRVSFLTGRYPSALRITHMGVPVPEETETIATLFGRVGYKCANIGKLHFLPHSNRDHTLPHPSYGFDHLEISDEPGVYEDDYRSWVRLHAPEQLLHLSCGLPPARRVWLDAMNWNDPVPHPDGNRSIAGRDDFVGAIPFPGGDDWTHSAFVGRRTIEYLEAQAVSPNPFLCIAGFYSPHAPWVVPQRFLDMYDPADLPLPKNLGDKAGSHVRSATHGYYAMVTEVDEWCGRILGTLEETGQAENTIVVFTSDHGEWLADRGRFGKGHPGDDLVSNVPLIVQVPSIKGAAKPDQTIVEALDVLPTLLELAGLPVPSSLQGQSLKPRLECPGSPGRESALTEFTHWRTLRTATHRYYVHDNGKETLAVIDLDGEHPLDIDDPTHAPDLSRHRHLMIQRMLQAEQPLTRTWPY